MRYSPLGKTGLNVSRVCLGTMTWGQQNSESDGHAQMDYATSRGVNFFDTAELYAVPVTAATTGRTEEIIGTWFEKTKKRSDVILATKIAGPGIPHIRGGSVLNREQVLKAVDSSLDRLRTDYIDLYQLHWPMRVSPHFGRNRAGILNFQESDHHISDAHFHEVLDALGDVVKQGKVRYIGLSDDTAWGIMTYLRLSEKYNLPRMHSIQNEFSLLNRSDDPYVAEVCVREDVSYLPWSPLAAGMLSGKYANSARPVGSRWHLEDQLPRRMPSFRDVPQSHAAVSDYIKVAAKYDLDVCQMALKFVDLQPFVTSTIIGATNLDQLKSNIDAFDLDLSSDVLSDINEVYKTYPLPF